MFGKQRVYEILRVHAAASAADIADRVIDDLDRFRENKDPEDDITLVVIKVKDPGKK